MNPAHLHRGPGANVGYFLLREAVSKAQGGESKSQKDWEPDHDTKVVDCHDCGKG
jgi:hypothetical protein